MAQPPDEYFWAILLLPFFILYSGVLTFFAVMKNRQAKKLLARLALHDEAWDIEALRQRVEKAYFSIQYAWRVRNLEPSRQYMSERLFAEHQEKLATRGPGLVMKDISLDSVRILQVLDRRDDAEDSFVALIRGSMVDHRKDQQGEIIEGLRGKHAFTELWTFKREPHGWVLDEIDHSASVSEVLKMQAQSEQHGDGS